MFESNIITGQYVRINQIPASVGERLVARLVDFITIIVYFTGITVILVQLDLPWTRTYTFFVIGIYLPVVFYSLLFEVLNNGQSLGKMLMGIRVVNKDGSSPTLGGYFLRWMIWIIDSFMGIGILVILLSKNSQRLGDIAAGTMVISVQGYKKIHVSLDEFRYLSSSYEPVYPQVTDLSLNQIDVIQRCLDSEYSSERSARISALYHKVHELLDIPYDRMSPDQFLYTIVRDYQHYALEEI